jgi:hypothetical protein
MMRSTLLIAVLSAAGLVAACATMGEDKTMSFFITSANPGKGGDLGGLAGADAWCKQLATAVGQGNKNWRAYLSTEPSGSQGAAHARDRIGKGPWYNSKGVMVASNVDELHGKNNLTKQTNITEKGEVVKGFGDPVPYAHDILTGSAPDGRAVGGATCTNWTAGSGSSAMVGHHDRMGTNPDPVANVSWNASHKTAGCSLPELARSGSAGYFYCFAAR